MPREAVASVAEGRPRRAVVAMAPVAMLVPGGLWCAGAERALAEGKAKSYPLADVTNQYTIEDYEDMRDDEERTSKYAAAIQRRLAGTRDAAVVDIGTGPFALLALIAARAGARRVYAIEREGWVAESARQAVKEAGFDGVVRVIQDDAVKVELPEKVDLVISEIVGSIATGESCVDIIRDARRRFLKAAPAQRPQMIPARCQTFVAPVSYAYHRLYKPGTPGMNRQLKLNTMSRQLTFLAKPQMLENFDFEAAGGDDLTEVRELTFDVAPAAAAAAGGFSGFAFWPRIELEAKASPESVIDVQGRPSAWPYVVVLTSPLPVAVGAPGRIRLTSDVDVSAGKFGRYAFASEVLQA